MKKIRLNADALEVLSFTTSDHPEGRGTVQGAQTGYPCYITVSQDERTNCLAYPESYWGEETCTTGPVEDTDPAHCVPIDTVAVTCMTCMTCPGVHPGC